MRSIGAELATLVTTRKRDDFNLRPPGPEPDSGSCWTLLNSVGRKCLVLNGGPRGHALRNEMDPGCSRRYKIVYKRGEHLTGFDNRGFGTYRLADARILLLSLLGPLFVDAGNRHKGSCSASLAARRRTDWRKPHASYLFVFLSTPGFSSLRIRFYCACPSARANGLGSEKQGSSCHGDGATRS